MPSQNRRRMDRSGELNLLDFPRLIFMVVVVFIIIFLLPTFASINTKNNAAEQMVLDRLIFNSISSFSYLDHNGRVHQGIIDLQKFEQESFAKAISLPKKGGVLLELSSDDGIIQRKIYLNEDYALLSGGLTSTFDVDKKKEPVLIKDGEKYVQGALEVTYVIKKNR